MSEQQIQHEYYWELLENPPSPESEPFETVWLGYRLPWTTSDEQVDLEYVFQDPTCEGRFNFMKCIWPRLDHH